VAASQIPRSISSSEKNHGFRFEGILKIEFARKSPSKGQKTGKFDYLGVPNHPAHSVAFEFFTDDYCLWLILKTLPEAPAFGGDMKAATASARVQRVRYSYSPSISLPV
jgi:hypothetical protein